MSFNRLMFDNGAYSHRLTETIGPGEYVLDRNAPCDPCFNAAPSVNIQRHGATLCDTHLIDVDSELIGITRKASKCPSKKYLPSNKPFCSTVPLRECNQLTHEPTRMSNPSCTLRCTGINRWVPLCHNPQEQVEIPFSWNVNNRIVVKDNHRSCVTTPMDQSELLPKPQRQEAPRFCGSVGEVHPLHFRSCGEIKQY